MTLTQLYRIIRGVLACDVYTLKAKKIKKSRKKD
jgi:hypothetical protein